MPLVFLHALGASSRYFAPRLGALPGQARCVLPDLLGFGLSPKPPEGAYTVADHLAALREQFASIERDAGVPTVLARPLPIVAEHSKTLQRSAA